MFLYLLHNDPTSLTGFYACLKYSEAWWQMELRGAKTWYMRLATQNMDKLAQDPEVAYMVAFLTKKPFKEGEHSIATSAKYSLMYAQDVLHGEFPEGEDAIATDPETSLMYAWQVLHRRFIKGEPIIATNASNSVTYANKVMKGRFELGEPAIFADKHLGPAYKRKRGIE